MINFRYNSIRDQPSTSSKKLIVVHNTPQVQLSVEQSVNEITQATENMHIDQVFQVIPNIIEQHNPQENVGATLRRSTRERT